MPDLEAFLARLYVDEALRARFLADPAAEARRAGFAEEEVARLAAIDRTGLELAAESFARKRAVKNAHPRGLLAHLRRFLASLTGR